MAEMIAGLLNTITYIVIDLCQLCSPIVQAFGDYFTKAFETGNPVVIIFALALPGFTVSQVIGFFKDTFVKKKT